MTGLFRKAVERISTKYVQPSMADLVEAGALIAAEIDKRLRARARSAP